MKPAVKKSPSIKAELLGDLAAQTGLDLGSAMAILTAVPEAKCRAITAALKSAYDQGRYDALQSLLASPRFCLAGTKLIT
jgi:hypothetical protein